MARLRLKGRTIPAPPKNSLGCVNSNPDSLKGPDADKNQMLFPMVETQGDFPPPGKGGFLRQNTIGIEA